MKQGRITLAIQGIIDELVSKAGVSNSYDLTGKKVFAADQDIGTASEALNIGDITTIDHIYLENLGPTNYVDVDSANTHDKFNQRLQVNDPALLHPNASATVYAKAHTAGITLRVVCIGS